MKSWFSCHLMLLVAVVACYSTEGFAEGQTLWWNRTGNVGLKTADACRDAEGNPATFTDGDNITFESHPMAVTYNVTLPANAVIGDLIFNVTNWVKGTKTYEPYFMKTGPIASATKIEKRGLGGITFDKGAHTFDCDITVLAGTLTFTPPDFTVSETYDFPTARSVIGSLDGPRTIYVGNGVLEDNARLVYRAATRKYLFCWEHQVPSNLTYVLNAGTLDLGAAPARVSVGRVVMKNGATLVPTQSTSSYSRTMFNDDITVERGEVLTKSQLKSSGHYAQIYFSSAGKRIVVDVDEVTSSQFEDGKWVDDGEVDLLMDLTLCDSDGARWNASGSYVDTVTNTAWSTRSSWIKRGPGTLQLDGANASRRSTYTGDVDIEEGTISVDMGPDGGTGSGTSSCIGNYFGDRRITVHTGAKLLANVFMLPNVDNKYNLANELMTVVVSNGTFRVEPIGGGSNIHLYGDADFEYAAGPDYLSARYLFWLGGDNRFALNRPYTFKKTKKANFGYNFISLDVRKEHTEEAVETEGVVTAINHTGYSGFDVVRSALDREDAAADVIFNVPLSSRSDITVDSVVHHFDCGVYKSGDGILQLKGDNTYTHDTIIEDGGLLIDGSVRTDVTVKEGGVVGGSGEVGGSFKVGNVFTQFPADLTIEEGGGFLVNATNVTEQVVVNGVVTLPQRGHLLICNYNGDPEQLSISGIGYPSVTATGSIEGAENVEPSTWTAAVDGWTAKENLHLVVSEGPDGLLKVDYKPIGFYMFVR